MRYMVTRIIYFDSSNFKSMNIFTLIYLSLQLVQGLKNSVELEGYPLGFLSDCPDSHKPLQLSKKDISEIYLIVQGPGDWLTATQRKYSYNHRKGLAKDPDLDFKKPTILYVCGYLIDQPGFRTPRYVSAHYRSFGYNALIVDITRFTTLFFPLTVRYMKSIGIYVAQMLVDLVHEGFDLSTLEVLGLSLGGQTMSFIANGYQNLTGTKLPLLIGLDPCGPCYRHVGPEDRLDPSDADFVIVLHSNIDGFGMATPMGHVDFYLNGGEYLPANLMNLPCTHACSHVLAIRVWMGSMNHPTSFIAMQCDSVQQARNRKCYDRIPMVTNIVGPRLNRSNQGLYYLSTSDTYPFYLGQKGLKKKYDYSINLLNASIANTLD